MPKEDIVKGDLIWGFIGKMQWSSGLVADIETITILANVTQTVYTILWSNGTVSEHYRHELSLPHEVAKEA